MKKVLIFDMENSLARDMARYFIDLEVEVLGVGINEKLLGSLNSCDLFTFRKFDLRKSDFLRSYLYGVDTILIIDSSSAILEKIDHLYQCLIHLKSRIPQVLLLSNYQVFGEPMQESYLEDEVPEPSSEKAKLLRGAEIMIENYSNHLESKGSILRIPKLISRKKEENDFKDLFNFLAKNIRFVLESKENFSLQWIQNSWNDFEIFHACDYENDVEEAFDELTEYIKSRSKIIKATKREMLLSKIMSLFPFLEEKLEDYVRETKSLQFMKVPKLNCKKTNSFFEFDVQEWQEKLRKKSPSSAS